MHALARKDLIDAKWHQVAAHAAWIMNMWITKGQPITADALLGRQRVRVSAGDFSSLAEAKAEALRYANLAVE